MRNTETSFGTWVRHRRKALDMTQQELARQVGCSISAIVKIESDERRPSRQIAELLAEYLQVPSEQRELFLKVARRSKAVDALEKIGDAHPAGPHAAYQLPNSPGPLIGREFELVEIARLIRDPRCRLLTLTGQGGIGKTHLALQMILNGVESRAFSATFVSLAAVNGREQAVTAIADALGIVLYAASDRAVQLLSYLQDKDLVIVLDNFEHLTADAGCVDLVGELLRGTRNVRILTTSRHPLQLQAEWVFEVQGLPVPKSNKPGDLETSSAVALFIQRANQVTMGFKPTANEIVDIAHICELVEGLPLGIELAAAWVRTLTCREIAEEIQKSLDFLATTARDHPERHRSLRATIEYSWHLLNAGEQRVLRQLSVFRGGFTRQAAEAVAYAGLTDLLALVSKLLIRRVGTGRYDMHELIHQYAMTRLAQEGDELDQVLKRHSRYFADLLAEHGPALKGRDRSTVVPELISELANLRQAWQWASSHAQALDLSRSADTLFWLYESRSNCREGVPLFGTAVESLQIQVHAQAGRESQLALGQVLCYQGYFLFRQGQHPQGREALISSLSVLKEITNQNHSDVKMALSNTIVFLGTVISVMGEFTEGDQLLQEGLRMKQELGDRWGTSFCLRQIGLSAYYRGEYDQSYQALEQSLVISRELGNPWTIAASLNQLGLDAYAQGKYDQADAYLADGLELSREVEDRASIAVALDGLGLVKADQGRFDEAKSYFQESIHLLKEIGEQGSLAQTLIHYGSTLFRMGNIDGAHRQFMEALSVASRAQITPVVLDALLGEAEIRCAAGDVESAFAIAWTVGQNPSSSHATRRRAESLCTGIEAGLDSQVIEVIKAKSVTMETLMQEVLSSID